MTDFDSSVYEPIAQTSADRLIPLLHAVLRAGKGVSDKNMKRALRLVRTAGEGLQEVFYAPVVDVEKPDTKAVDNQVDVMIGTISQRILDWTSLGGRFAADAPEAQRVHTLLFPDGTGFLKLAFRKQWAHCDRLMKTIETEKLGPQLDKWVGAPFLAYARDRVEEYGRVLGITEASVVPETTLIVDHIADTRRALATYVRASISQVELDLVEASVVIKALRPIAELRAEARAAPAGKKEEPAPTVKAPAKPEPLPPVDD